MKRNVQQTIAFKQLCNCLPKCTLKTISSLLRAHYIQVIENLHKHNNNNKTDQSKFTDLKSNQKVECTPRNLPSF